MNLKHLESFVAVAEHLHFTRAANALGVAQPALSQQIRKLERELGVDLFVRTSRNVELSEFGRALLPRARLVLRQVEVARSEVREIAGLTRGRLHVGASGTIAAFLLPDILARYRSLYPEIVLEITQRRSEATLDLVEAGTLDVGLVRLPFRPTSLDVTPVLTEPLYAALPPRHPLADRAELRLEDLEDDAFIMPAREEEPFYGSVLNLCAEAGFTPTVISAGAEYTTVFRLVGMGMGVSIISALGTHLQVEPTPAFVRIDAERAISPIVLVASPTEALPPSALAFRDLVLRWHRPSDS